MVIGTICLLVKLIKQTHLTHLTSAEKKINSRRANIVSFIFIFFIKVRKYRRHSTGVEKYFQHPLYLYIENHMKCLKAVLHYQTDMVLGTASCKHDHL